MFHHHSILRNYHVALHPYSLTLLFLSRYHSILRNHHVALHPYSLTLLFFSRYHSIQRKIHALFSDYLYPICIHTSKLTLRYKGLLSLQLLWYIQRMLVQLAIIVFVSYVFLYKYNKKDYYSRSIYNRWYLNRVCFSFVKWEKQQNLKSFRKNS